MDAMNDAAVQCLVRAMLAVKQLDRMGCVVARVESGWRVPIVHVFSDEHCVLRGKLVKTVRVADATWRSYHTRIQNCEVRWEVREAPERRDTAQIPAPRLAS